MEPANSISQLVCENENCFPQCSEGVNYNNLHSSYEPQTLHDNNEVLRRLYRPHGTLARTLYYKYLADERLQRLDRNKWYQCETSGLPDSVQSRFLPLALDRDTEIFLDQASHKSDWIFTQVWYSVAKSFLRFFMSQTSINGLLGRGSMFVFSLDQFLQLMDVTLEWRGGALLDLGAGDGRTTAAIAPVFHSVYVTEISGPMRWILSKRGFQVLDIDTWSNADVKFDVITCLNLLDRCDKPLSLLQELRQGLAPGGRVVVALVLPFSPYVEIAVSIHQPKELLPIQGSTFEQQVSSAITDVFEPAGFLVERWSRVPYLCEGDLNQAFYWLDDAIFILSQGPQQEGDDS